LDEIYIRVTENSTRLLILRLIFFGGESASAIALSDKNDSSALNGPNRICKRHHLGVYYGQDIFEQLYGGLS